MGHDVSKVVLAGHLSSAHHSESFAVDPASFLAGFCVSLGSDGLPSLLKSAGMRIGVSRGASLSDHKKTAVTRSGLKVPVRASLKRSTGTITITNFSNLLTTTPDSVTIGSSVFVAQAGAATLGTLFFRAATSNDATATSLAAQINSHATASTLVYAVASAAVVTLYSIVEGAATGNDVAVAYTDNGGGNIGITLAGLTGGKLAGGSNTISSIDYTADGAKMYINDVTGKADANISGFTTVSDAIYRGIELTGIAEDASEVAAVIVDMTGGL